MPSPPVKAVNLTVLSRDRVSSHGDCHHERQVMSVTALNAKHMVLSNDFLLL